MEPKLKVIIHYLLWY